ncbi:helix-turn-helix transcriptional regulator [Mesorhizobium sp. M7A.F.Ce.TU.012.03.2.1]|uniref:helix-turn-helix domain-containing protein n=1 Tax=Mesorhizobium sp. M7A.F.Ce.TU.012.03.2.1 TaxID=2493681 RepID=UPI0032AEDD49
MKNRRFDCYRRRVGDLGRNVFLRRRQISNSRELATAAGVTANTVTRIENGADAKQSTIEALKRALEAAGVIFLADGETVDGGPGVRLRTCG